LSLKTALPTPHSLEKIVQELLTSAAEAVSAEAALFFLHDTAAEALRLCGCIGLPETFPGNLKIAVGEGIEGWVVRERAPLVLNEVGEDPRFTLHPELDHLKSVVSFPVLFAGEVLGVVTVGKILPSDFTAQSVRKLQETANPLAEALHHAITEKEKLEEEHELEALMRIINLSGTGVGDVNRLKYLLSRELPSLLNLDAARVWTFEEEKQETYCSLIASQGNLKSCPALDRRVPLIANQLSKVSPCKFIGKKSGIRFMHPAFRRETVGNAFNSIQKRSRLSGRKS